MQRASGPETLPSIHSVTIWSLLPCRWSITPSIKIGCITIPTGVGNTEQQVHIMKNLKVTAFCGTPSFLLNIAEKAEEMGLDLGRDLNLRVGFVAAEMFPESLRSKLEEKFGMTIRQSYGTADIGCLGYECMEKNGMHIPDDKIVEIVDPANRKTAWPRKGGGNCRHDFQ